MRKKIIITTVSVMVVLSLGIYGCSVNKSFAFGSSETSSAKQSVNEASAANASRKLTASLKQNIKVNFDDKNKVVQTDVQSVNNNSSQDMKPGTVDPVVDKPLAAKEVFLTFDDGPSSNTKKILNILAEKGVKASFFVLGSNAEKYPDLIKAERNAGMTVLNHSYSHNYSMYKTIESCVAEFQKTDDILKNILGEQPLGFMRFPGGSDNHVSKANVMNDIRNTFVNSGKAYVDWNISSGDAASATVPADTIKNNVLNDLSKRNFGVALMHDAAAKTTTVEALPAIIDTLKAQGFVFRTFGELTITEKNEMIKKKIINRGLHK